MQPNANPNVMTHQLTDGGGIPNNRLPLLLYRGVLPLTNGAALPASVQDLFQRNEWSGAWVNGIFDYDHYHSTAHETLGCFSGTARVRFGGDKGVVVDFEAGDVVVIPAGVGHKNLGSSPDFGVVGAYPVGQENDLCHGKEGERPEADRAIARVPLPAADPVYGRGGPLHSYWKPGHGSV
jgi:uncharacterized protein YjlB